MEQEVLVCVIKNPRDFEILLNEKWYRIPIAHLPKRKFSYIAFYQPLKFGDNGKCIRMYGKVKNQRIFRRIHLLPLEKEHPRALEKYLKISISKLITLDNPILNVVPRRIVFGFTSLEKLLTANDILELYDIAPIEQIIEEKMKQDEIYFQPQYYVLIDKTKRYRLDFAIFCRKGKIAIECDNLKSHSLHNQKILDQAKDSILRELGWEIIRLSEKQILTEPQTCIKTITDKIVTLGGQSRSI